MALRNNDKAPVIDDVPARMEDRWKQRWPGMRGCLVNDPEQFHGDAAQYAREDIDKRLGMGYKIEPLTREERLVYCKSTMQLLMLVTEERYQQNQEKARRAHPATPAVTEDVLE